jgi:Reverse transcriptase (RNA-dependent DNA polymerase)
VTLSQHGTDSANESFVTAPEEPSYAEMAFHVEIDMMMTTAAHNANGDPCSISEAQSRPNWPKWQCMMEREIETLKHTGTWDTVPRPEGKNVIGSKWVFRLKRKADGTIDKYKACLVVCGFTQIYSVDYFDTFSPVAKLASIRTILVIAAHYDWDIDTFDFNSAYLNGERGRRKRSICRNPQASRRTVAA